MRSQTAALRARYIPPMPASGQQRTRCCCPWSGPIGGDATTERNPNHEGAALIGGGRFRTVSRLENEAVLDRMQARLAKRPDILDRRRESAEHPFGTIKQWMNQGAFLMRGLEKVRAEFSLTALAYNLRRALNLVGFTELMAALAA